MLDIPGRVDVIGRFLDIMKEAQRLREAELAKYNESQTTMINGFVALLTALKPDNVVITAG